MSSAQRISLDPNSTHSVRFSDRAKAHKLGDLMALFFDSDWFDSRLAALGLRRADVAAALGFNAEEISEIWKDQRELKAGDVRTLSALLGVPAAEIADRAGVSTPTPKDVPSGEMNQIGERLDRIERTIVEIKALLLELRAKSP